jgi:AmiR/NasT family two-component response regulator
VRRLVELTAILARRCAQLQEALESRIVIEQAKGVLAERFQLEPDKAFDVLRRGARSHRVPLHDLARQVVSSQETPLEIAAQIDGVAVPAKR